MTPEPRRCGSCTACCTVLGVTAIDKPEHSRCSFLSGASAGVGRACLCYADRPAECGTYRCLWLAGFGGRADRPDDLGVILDHGANGNRMVIIAREVYDGASKGQRAFDVIAKLRQSKVVVVATRDGQRHASGPRALIQAFLASATRPR